jgi:hypothetical protein
VSKTTLVRSINPVKTDFELGLYVIEWHHRGLPDELVYIPRCNRCGKPITDPDQANLVTEDCQEDEPLKEVGRIEDLPLLLHPGRVRIYHFECDSGATPWRRLSTVLRKDQRWEWERW